jgi:hypothetical protein
MGCRPLRIAINEAARSQDCHLRRQKQLVAEDESKYYGWIRARIQMAYIYAGDVMCTVIRLEAQGNNSISAVTMNATYI